MRLEELNDLCSCLSPEQRDELLQCRLIAAPRGGEALINVLEQTLLCHATSELIDEHCSGAPMNAPAISLGRLACACHLYDAMTDYGRSWRSFRDTVRVKLVVSCHRY
jgi:hypothetical protein